MAEPAGPSSYQSFMAKHNQKVAAALTLLWSAVAIVNLATGAWLRPILNAMWLLVLPWGNVVAWRPGGIARTRYEERLRLAATDT